MAHLKNLDSKCDAPACSARAVVQIISGQDFSEAGKYCRRHGTTALNDADALDREAELRERTKLQKPAQTLTEAGRR